MPFIEPADVVVKQSDDENWLVEQTIVYAGKDQTFTVPIGSPTDFASVPRLFVWFLPRYGRYTKAAILHDYLWRHEVPAGRLTWVDADGVFRRAMRELNVPFMKRWIMWAAVRWGALGKPDGRVGWIRQSPRVLLMTVVSLPFVIPAAVVVGLELVAFWLLELLLFVPLKIISYVKTTVLHQDAKKVVAPGLDVVSRT